jgi:hypothetical protein
MNCFGLKIVMDSAMEGFKSRKIHIDLEVPPQETAVRYFTVTKYLRLTSFDCREPRPVDENNPPTLNCVAKHVSKPWHSIDLLPSIAKYLV